MATVAIWKVEKRLDRVIKYVIDKTKTQDINLDDNCKEIKLYVDGINCNSNSALLEMNLIKKRFNKENGILGFHAYHSFKEGEVTPEEAHKIGLELANEMWGDKFQVIVATHVNTKHIHNHFVINSVSFVDGKRYYDTHSTYGELRRLSNMICEEHNLSVLKEKETRKGLNYNNFQNQNNLRNNYYKLAKYNLDIAISKAHTYNEFIKIMDNMNYDVIERSGKISIRDRDYKRNIRIERYYGEDYSIDNIKKQIKGLYIPVSRIYYKDKSIDLFSNKLITGNKNLLRIYIKYLHLLNLYPKYVQKNRISSELKKDIFKMDEISEQAKLLVKNNIETDQQFYSYYDNQNNELFKLINKKEGLKDKSNISEINDTIRELKKEIKLLETIRNRKENIKNNIETIEKEVVNNEHIR